MKRIIISAIILVSVPFDKVWADNQKAVEQPRPILFQDVVDCRNITDSTQRLACYDSKVAALDAAEKNEDIVLTDREGIKETRKGLFGFSLPQIKIFSSKKDEELNELTSKIQSARLNRDGGWFVSLEDGAQWQQIDTRSLVLSPKPGMTIIIRKAALGSYLAKIGSQPAIKMKRVN